MKKLSEKRAEELKAQGITHIASTVKSHYNTVYYKYETIDTILANGGKMPKYARSIHGYIIDTNGRQIDWNHTICWSRI